MHTNTFFLIMMFWVIFFIAVIFLAVKVNSYKKKRILAKLDGELGVELKKRLPSNAKVYAADTNAITWQEFSGNGYIVLYSSLGFANLPKGYELDVCSWIRDNIVLEKENYHFESMTYNDRYYEPSNSMTIERDYAGNYTAKTNPGKYVSTETTIGYALVYNGYDFEGYRVKQTPLKKW